MYCSSLIRILIPFLWFQASYGKEKSFPELPAADNYFHLYALPVGQGDSFILQCPLPGGEVSVFDMGSSNSSGKLWSHEEVYKFLNKRFDKVRNILVTHNHQDHYGYLPKVFNSTSSVQSIQKIFISCTKSHLNDTMKEWVKKFKLSNKLVTHNNGSPCGLKKKPCRPIDLCPNSTIKVDAKILIANWGQGCDVKAVKTNANSQVVMLKVENVKVLLNGDFEDFTDNPKEKGPLKELVDYYGEELVSHVYQLSHHGASKLANKNFLLDAVRPKAVFVSSNPYHQHAHPRCSVIDYLINKKMLCKPSVKQTGPFYCGSRPANNGSHLDMELQEVYTCGESNKVLRNVTDNEFAIYTTVPNKTLMNLIEFKTDGIAWGFTNNLMTKIDRKRGRE